MKPGKIIQSMIDDHGVPYRGECEYLLVFRSKDKDKPWV